MKNILRSIAATATVLLAFTVVPAASAATHELGELVDYPLTAPVDGDHYFADWFWAARSHGIHHAQDLMSPKMTPVVAAADGTVRLVNWTSQDHMNPDRCCTIALRHNDGWESWYIHLNNDTPGTDDGLAWGIADGIVPGTPVTAGQLIGWVGDSGTAELTGPHLHFELRDPAGVIVNPFQSLADAGANWIGGGPADPLFDGYRLIEDGTRGADVRRLQSVLTELAYQPGSIDGVSGPRTIAAVTAFQTDAGLKADGLAGRVTRAALKTRYASGTTASGADTATETATAGEESSGASAGTVTASGILREGSRGADVQRVQELLTNAGYSPGPHDGIFGPKTKVAVLAFQDDHGLRIDGLVGSNTRSALGF
ncbi:MAG: peptidoglycan-binding protein [Actinomycetota bacterium]|nr:peptidoglycan-binding protein [Actinomycetota bacterium]